MISLWHILSEQVRRGLNGFRLYLVRTRWIAIGQVGSGGRNPRQGVTVWRPHPPTTRVGAEPDRPCDR